MYISDGSVLKIEMPLLSSLYSLPMEHVNGEFIKALKNGDVETVKKSFEVKQNLVRNEVGFSSLVLVSFSISFHYRYIRQYRFYMMSFMSGFAIVLDSQVHNTDILSAFK